MAFRQTTEEYIAKAKAVWGEEYDYSQTVYRGPLRKVTIICRLHGPFEQYPYNHVRGHHCYQCGRDMMRLTAEKFLARARALFGEYDYSQIVYQGALVKLTINCPAHGPFQRRPSELLCGRGCPKCCHKPRPKRGPQFGLEEWQVALVREVLVERRVMALSRSVAGREMW